MAWNWTCPNCGTHTTLQSANVRVGNTDVFVGTAEPSEAIRLTHSVIKCPNTKCAKFTVDVNAYFYPSRDFTSGGRFIPDGAKAIGPVGPGLFRFEPRVAQPLSQHVPRSSANDYAEACLIKDLSPKAAATLCRRSLQGLIRGFWGISKPTLAAELRFIENQCDPALYRALMSLKGIGNIGAHPERDIDLIVDVEPGEVDELLELLRLLDAEWFIARHLRDTRLASISTIGSKKASEQAGTGVASPVPPPAP